MASGNRKTLDVFVNEANFAKLETYAFDSAIKACIVPTRKHAEDALLGLRRHVSYADFPDDKSCTFATIEKILYKIHHAAMDAEKRNEYTETDLVPQLKELFYACLQHCPTRGHLAVLDHILRGWHLDKKYIKLVKGAEAKRLFSALKVTYKPMAADVDQQKLRVYVRHFTTFYKDIFLYIEHDSKDVLAEFSPWVAELYLHYVHQMAEADDNDTAIIFREILSQIRSTYKTYGGSVRSSNIYHLYCHLPDPQLLLNHLKEFKAFVVSNTFMKHACFKEYYDDWLIQLMMPLIQAVAYGAEYVSMYSDLVVTMENTDAQFYKYGISEALKILKKAGEHIVKNSTVSCEDLAAKIEQAPEINQAVLRDMAKSFVGQKFKLGDVPQGAFQVLTSLVRTAIDRNCYCAYNILREGAKLSWKSHETDLQRVLGGVIDACIQLGARDVGEYSGYRHVALWVTEKAVELKMFRLINSELQRGIVAALSNPKEYPILHHALMRPTAKVDWKMFQLDISRAHEAYRGYIGAIGRVGKNLTKEDDDDYFSLVKNYLRGSITAIIKMGVAGEFSGDVAACMTAMFSVLQEAVAADDDYLANTYKDHISEFMPLINPLCDKAAHVAPLLPVWFKMVDADIDGFSQYWALYLPFVGRKQPSLLADRVPSIIAVSFKLDPAQAVTLPSVFRDMYPHGAEHMHAGLEAMLLHAKSHLHVYWPITIINLMLQVAEKHPQAITATHCQLAIDMIEVPNVTTMVYTVLDKVATHNPVVVANTLATIVDKAYGQLPEGQPFAARILGSVGMSSETEGDRRVRELLGLISKTDKTHHSVILSSIKDIANLYPAVLVPHKDTILSIKTKLPVLTEACDSLLDIIEGRSLAGLSEDVGEQKAELKVVKQDVSSTKKTVAKVSTKVERQGREIQHVKADVTKVEGRLDQVEEIVDETVKKVEEVDLKTMTNAPAWSRDVSQLLNPQSDQDWRLLGQRLGYSTADIRGWATQHDPCMAVLSEWYATHKTREATHGVLKALEEMSREDAAMIIRKAKQDGDAVLEDEEGEIGPLPPVFLSYQWAHQPHVKLLERHLANAGFRCWMDTGQMGGGDKLFAKIDAGMRAAAVTICCVSEKYAKSDNCTREVNLAVNLGKPIIPLLMEKMKWPPEGAMGPIFGEYLFIRFCQRSGEETNDERFWPSSKFEELLMQLRYSIVPDQSIITDPYRNWWEPKNEENIKIPVVTKKADSHTAAPTDKVQDVTSTSQPEVFLSYQWGKQPQIKALFARLTSLGYTCWMDIHQMGGGDSLYEKIDKGVRNAKVVICCVTPKYAMSANCRREVSLADALNKPMIPLLLEKMTWPPEGPMSMIMTQLLYIAFSEDPETQSKWTGNKMDELIQKINVHVPTGEISPGSKDKLGQSAIRNVQTSKLLSQQKPTVVVDTKNDRKSASTTKEPRTKMSSRSTNPSSNVTSTQPAVTSRPSNPSSNVTSTQPAVTSRPYNPSSNVTSTQPAVTSRPSNPSSNVTSTQPAVTSRPPVAGTDSRDDQTPNSRPTSSRSESSRKNATSQSCLIL